MERMLVPLDESSLAEAILPIVIKLAREEDGEVILLHAVEFHPLPSEDQLRAEAQTITEAENRLRAMAARLETEGIRRVRWVVWSAEPVQAIHDAAKSYRSDLIAMATHGRGGLSRLLLGSVATAVVRSAPVPVLLIRGQLPERTWSLRKLLVPLSGDKESEAILPVAERLAGPADLELHLLAVLEPLPATVETFPAEAEVIALRRVEAERHLEEVTERLSAKGLRVTWSIRAGRAPETIISVAREGGVDLIAMATHGRGLLGRLAFGSVADTVLRASPVPVLLFRVNESE